MRYLSSNRWFCRVVCLLFICNFQNKYFIFEVIPFSTDFFKLQFAPIHSEYFLSTMTYAWKIPQLNLNTIFMEKKSGYLHPEIIWLHKAIFSIKNSGNKNA